MKQTIDKKIRQLWIKLLVVYQIEPFTEYTWDLTHKIKTTHLNNAYTEILDQLNNTTNSRDIGIEDRSTR